MIIHKKILVGKNVEDASNVLEKLREEEHLSSVMLLFIKRGSKNIMEIMSFSEYKKQFRKPDYVLFSIANDREETFMIVESLIGGYFSKNERYSADDFFDFIDSVVGSELYEIISTGNKRDKRSSHNSLHSDRDSDV